MPVVWIFSSDKALSYLLLSAVRTVNRTCLFLIHRTRYVECVLPAQFIKNTEIFRTTGLVKNAITHNLAIIVL